ncbi:MAG: NAD(P)-dependent alcohol dehydrogenase [Bryobacter sp.]
MRQVLLEAPFGLSSLALHERELPKTTQGSVLVAIRATSLNYRDLLVATGRYNPRMPLPRVPLSDGAGEVIAVGEGISRWRVGDRVAGIFMQTWLDGPYREHYGKSALGGAIDGVLAEVVAFHEDGLVAVPEHLTWEEAACLPCAAVTAWNALFATGSVKPGETVLVQGSGGVSIFALQFARSAGARVIATSSSAAKAERLEQLGAELVVDYQQHSDWGKQIAKLGGADHVVEVGGAGSLEQSLSAVKAGGEVSVIGIVSGSSAALNIAPILHKHIKLNGIYVGSRAMFEAMNRALVVQQIRPVIDSVYPMDQIQKALEHLESAKHFGKIVVRVS